MSDNELLFEMVLETIDTVTKTGIPPKLFELTCIVYSEYIQEYTPGEFLAKYAPYVDDLVEKMNDMVEQSTDVEVNEDTNGE